MANYEWFRKFLAEELFSVHIELNRRNLDQVADYIVKRLESKRLTIVPTFLDDNMFHAQKNLNPEITFNQANSMYSSAVETFAERAALKLNQNSVQEENY
jgi:hypothetical protein